MYGSIVSYSYQTESTNTNTDLAMFGCFTTPCKTDVLVVLLFLINLQFNYKKSNKLVE